MEFHVSLVGRKDLSGEIYRQLRRAIVDGVLAPGALLPPTRELARRLSVSRTTVTVAYDRLAGEGYVTSRIGAGTFVSFRKEPVREGANKRRIAGALHPRAVWESIRLPARSDRPPQFNFLTGMPDPSLFPHQAWRRLVAHELRSPPVGGGAYGATAGHPGLRQAISRHISASL
jgi:GntR family transcriptional regulator/MocR family aminotransferase